MTDFFSSVNKQSRPIRFIKVVLAQLGSCLFWVRYSIEHVLVVEFEAVQRLLRLADPSVRSEERRIRAITQGRLSKPTRKFFILVLFPPSSLPGFTQNLIDALKPGPFNLVAVLNAELSSSAKQRLIGECSLLIERENVGGDFGGYKDAIGVIGKRCDEIERLVIANDSVFYFKDGLDKLIVNLDGPEDFIGVSEVFRHHYHVASFLVSFGRGIIRSKVFTDFWARFRPIGTRRWNIFKGEGALTAKLMRAGFRPHILFRAETLRPHLRVRNDDELAALLALLPTKARERAVEELRATWARSLLASGMIDCYDAQLNDEIANIVVHQIMWRNQMHTAGFLFRRHLNLPVIKRDILFRQIYPLDEISSMLADLDPSTREEVMADLPRRGTAADLGFLRKVLYRHSAL